MNYFNKSIFIYCILSFVLIGHALYAYTRDISLVEQMDYQRLNLKADATDDEIIKKLDDGSNKIYAMGLIQRKNITTAIPKLLVIVKDEHEHVLARSMAAKVLNFFGNKDWIKTIKTLTDSYEPKNIWEVYNKIYLAGALAMAEDYSNAGFVLDAMDRKELFVRMSAAGELAKFVHKTNPISDVVSDALLQYATTDPNALMRGECIYSLENMSQKRPDYKSKLIKALNSNIASEDKKLRELCKEKLEYSKKDN